MKIVLASNSPRRRELLQQIGLTFEVVSSEFEENEIEMEPEELVKYFAYMKANSVYKKIYVDNRDSIYNAGEDIFIIGADTVVYCDKILGKPESPVHAQSMLSCLSGREHYVYTGISVINALTGKQITDYERTKVFFKNLSQNEINSYIKTGEPSDKAGAYGIQGKGSLFVEKIDGCYFNVVGFPIYKFSKIMEQFNAAII